MYPYCLHILPPLTELVDSKGALKWSSMCQKALDEVKSIMAKDAFLRYPDHNKQFDIYRDGSDLQLGTVIMQDGYAMAYYSRKLNSTQRNYTLGEKELLSIVETLRSNNAIQMSKHPHLHRPQKKISASVNTASPPMVPLP